jgi:DNA-binding response OmpR family regulator
VNILVIEDDRKIELALKKGLESESFAASHRLHEELSPRKEIK